MKSSRIKILAEVNLDMVPGWGNQPEDFVEAVKRALPPWYEPTVEFAGYVSKEKPYQEQCRDFAKRIVAEMNGDDA